eukprot:12280339-Ditylum_brightwellii.AAC.1
MQATEQYSCQREVKDQLLSSHRKCVQSQKCTFYMALKLKGIKIPQKRLRRSDRIVVRRDPGLED